MRQRFVQLHSVLLLGLLTISLFSASAATAQRPQFDPRGVPDTRAQQASPNDPRALVPTSHDRLGQLVWEMTGPNIAHFEATAGSRRSYPGYPSPPNVGDLIQFATLIFGDGFQSSNQLFTVTFVDIPNDYILANKDEDHTYSSAGPFTAYFGSCCRLSAPQHINNPDLNFRAETIVNFATAIGNPVTSFPPIVDCPQEGICTFLIPGSDPDNHTLRFRLATANESGDARFVQPGLPQAPLAATINSTTGRYTWDTHGATINGSGMTFYSTQVMIEALDGSGQVVTKTPLDFFIKLLPATTNNPPTFVYPPTPPDGTTVTISAGNTLTFNVRAQDADAGNTVSLSAVGLPAGASFPIPAPANPVQSTFSWTPTGTDTGSHTLNFLATDSLNAQTLTSMNIVVLPNTATATAPPTGTPTDTPTATPTTVPSSTATTVPSNTATSTATPVPSNTATHTVTPVPSSTATHTPPPVPSGTATHTATPVPSSTATHTPPPVPSGTPPPTSTAPSTATRTATALPSGTPRPASATPSATPVLTVCPIYFQDVPPTDPFFVYVRCLTCRALLSGYPCGSPGEPCVPGNPPYFRPTNQATRGQIAKILSNAAGYAEVIPATQQTFHDVPPGSTFWTYVERLVRRGFLTGYPCGGPFEPCVGPTNRPYFRSNTAVTRGQLAKMDTLTAGWTETPTAQTFADVPPGSTFYLPIERLAGRGLIQGYPCGGATEPCGASGNRPYFRPGLDVTRAQTAKIITNSFFPNCQTPSD